MTFVKIDMMTLKYTWKPRGPGPDETTRGRKDKLWLPDVQLAQSHGDANAMEVLEETDSPAKLGGEDRHGQTDRHGRVNSPFGRGGRDKQRWAETGCRARLWPPRCTSLSFPTLA